MPSEGLDEKSLLNPLPHQVASQPRLPAPQYNKVLIAAEDPARGYMVFAFAKGAFSSHRDALIRSKTFISLLYWSVTGVDGIAIVDGVQVALPAFGPARAICVAPIAFSETLPGYDPMDLEDLELRRKASFLNPPTSQVVLTEKGHPAMGLVCEICGFGMKLLSSCGVVLCIPCWHKSAIRSFEEVYPVVEEAIKQRESSNMRSGIRYATLPVHHHKGESLRSVHSRLWAAWNKLRRNQFWKSHVEGAILKREITYGVNGWHPHLSMIIIGRFIPATKSRAKPGEENLSDVWHAITGDSSIVHIETPHRPHRGGLEGRELVKELAKYVTKPTAQDEDGTGVRIDGWPEDVRLELAQVLAGGIRTKWYCRTHRSRSRKGCLNYIPRDGMRLREKCEGQYRKERTGYRRLIWYGRFKRIRDDLAGKIAPEEPKAVCKKCEIGRLKTEYWWDEDEYGRHIHPNADLALQFIQAHKSTDYDSLMEYFKDQNKEGPPRGWIPNYENAVRTPLRGVRNEEIAYHILGCLRSGVAEWYAVPRSWNAIQDSFGDELAKAGYAARCQLEKAGYIEGAESRRSDPECQLTGKGKWRMHCWHTNEEDTLREEPPPEDPGVPCVDSENCADRWRLRGPFSGGLE